MNFFSQTGELFWRKGQICSHYFFPVYQAVKVTVYMNNVNDIHKCSTILKPSSLLIFMI